SKETRNFLVRLLLPRPNQFTSRIPIMSTTMTLYALMCTLLITLFRGPTQFLIFHALFGSVEIAGFVYVVLVYLDANKWHIRQPTRKGLSEPQYLKVLEQHRSNV